MHSGIDLAGLPKNPTGWFVLPGMAHGLAYSDDEIISACENAEIVAIDAPLSFPDGWFRDCDRELFRMGFRPLSPRLKGMQPLARRAIRIAGMLREQGKEVIEVFAKASISILHLSKEWAEQAAGRMSDDEFDALACALTAKLYGEGKYREIGKECRIILPAP